MKSLHAALPAVLLAVALSAGAAPDPEAKIDRLQALNLFAEGSRPEALRWLARSLRREPEGNPAGSLAFQLLTDLRVQSALRLRGHSAAVHHAAFSRDGTKIVTSSADHTARVWDARTGAQLTPPLVHDDEVQWADFSSDAKLVATAGEDGIARVWDAATGRLVSATAKDPEDVKFVRFTADGQRLAGGTENQGCLWDPQTGKPAVPPFAYHDNVFSIDFSPDGSTLVAALGDDRAEIFDAGTGESKKISMPHGSRVFIAKYSADGTRVFTCSADRTARVWDAKTGQPVTPPMEHGFWIFGGDYSADGTRVATGSTDHTARVWDAKTGQPLTPPLQHGGPVRRVAFSPDSSRLATAAEDGSARVWDAATGEPVLFPIRPGAGVTTAAFSPDGRSLLVAAEDGSVQLVDLPPPGPTPAWVADLADFASMQVKYDESLKPDLAKITALRQTLLDSKSDSAWDKFGQWYFAEGAVRPISPWSTVSLQEYVDSLIAIGDRPSIDYAISLARDQPSWMVKLIPLQAKLGDPAPAPAPDQD